MNCKGMWLSIEAGLSLMILALLVLHSAPKQGQNLEDLYIIQKENDLLRVWAKEWPVSIQEMERDFTESFGGKSGELWIGGENRIIGGPCNRDCISSEMRFFDSRGQSYRVAVMVFK